MKRALWLLLLAAAIVAAASPAVAAEHRLGFGVHYWKTVDEIEDDLPDFEVDDNGLSGVFSYQYVAGLIRVEAAAEYFDKGFQGSTDWAVSPQVYLLAGRGIYGGVGMGVTYSNFDDGDWSDPFFIAKAGIDLLLLPKIHLDLNADYRFAEWEQLDDFDSDTITLGATVRFSF